MTAKLPANAPEVLERVRDELPLVDVIASQVRRQLGGSVMLDELVSFGREGLLAAARTFDPRLGVPFRRWANYRVRGAILDGIRGSSMLPRSVYQRLRAAESAHHAAEAAAEDGTARHVTQVAAEEADARLGSYLANIATAVALGLLAAPPSTGGASGSGVAMRGGGESASADPGADEILAREETLAAVRAAMAELPEQERHLIQRHYFDDVRLDEAAAELGLSKSWGSRLHGRAIETLTRHMKKARTTG